MKHFILVFILSFLFVLSVYSQENNDILQIKKMNVPEIVIGKEKKNVGGTFYLNEPIIWSGKNGAIYAQNLRTKEYYIITQVAFESKSVNSVANYILTCKASTRGMEGRIQYAHNIEKIGGEKRIALLIGNSNYLFDSFLKNPICDVESISSELVELGFDTYSYFDCTDAQMKNAISAFQRRAQNYNVALFYYAGHGISWDNRYYYVPVNVELDKLEALNSCIEGYSLLNQLKSNNRITLILLDACRTRKQSWARGMEDNVKIQMEAPINMAVVYSTSDGIFALDGDSNLSPFAEGFITAIRKPGMSFTDCTIDINKFLFEKTGNAQNATQSNSLTEQFFFQPSGANKNVLKPITPNHHSVQHSGGSPSSDFSSSTPLTTTRDGNASNSVISFKFPEEQLAYGLKYYEGNGVKQDFNKAFLYLKPLAEMGCSEAFFPVADMYHRGNGVNKDRAEAERWYIKAASAGNVQAKKILLEKF